MTPHCLAAAVTPPFCRLFAFTVDTLQMPLMPPCCHAAAAFDIFAVLPPLLMLAFADAA